MPPPAWKNANAVKIGYVIIKIIIQSFLLSLKDLTESEDSSISKELYPL